MGSLRLRTLKGDFALRSRTWLAPSSQLALAWRLTGSRNPCKHVIYGPRPISLHSATIVFAVSDLILHGWRLFVWRDCPTFIFPNWQLVFLQNHAGFVNRICHHPSLRNAPFQSHSHFMSCQKVRHSVARKRLLPSSTRSCPTRLFTILYWDRPSELGNLFNISKYFGVMGDRPYLDFRETVSPGKNVFEVSRITFGFVICSSP